MRVPFCSLWEPDRISSFSGRYFPAFGLNIRTEYAVQMRENTVQKNSEYEYFLRS